MYTHVSKCKIDNRNKEAVSFMLWQGNIGSEGSYDP
jgi:hypothetical protein